MIALHGFLGLSKDWESLKDSLNLKPRDLWQDLRELPASENSFDAWADRFVKDLEPGDWVLGYSMGGRLALRAGLRAPEKVGGLVLVSAHPGLRADSAKEMRRRGDHVWAERFRKDPWNEVLPAWMSQSVLKPAVDHELQREEAMFDRELLARAMEVWSLGAQADLTGELLNLEIPVLHITGSEDEKFTGLIESLDLPPTQVHNIIEGAGHRVPWEKPGEFVAAVEEFHRFFT